MQPSLARSVPVLLTASKSGKRSAHSAEDEAARRWEMVEKEVERAARQSKNAETTRLLQRSLVRAERRAGISSQLKALCRWR